MKHGHDRVNFFVVLVAAIAAIAGILFGFDTGVISGALLFIHKEFALTPGMQGFVVAAVLIGAVIGSILSGRVTDYYGRRSSLIVTAVIFFVGTLMSAVAHDINILILGRFIVGLAIGVASFAAPLYISEIAPAKYRGALVSLFQLAVTLGIMLAYMVDTMFAQMQSWRWMFGTGMIPAAILFLGMLFLPQSPRWLLLKGMIENSRKTLQKIRNSDNVDEEIEEIRKSLVTRGNWKVLFANWTRPALIIAIGLSFFQQFTGINTIIYYAPTIFQKAGFHSDYAAIMAGAGVGVVNVIFTIIVLPLIDYMGRRMLLLIGLVGMFIALCVMTVSFHLSLPQEIQKWALLWGMVLYIACFAISLGPIMWLMFSEVFPLEVRGFGASVSAASNWAFNGIVAWIFPVLVAAIGMGNTFGLFAILSLVGLVFVVMLVPETKGTTLEQIEINLRDGVPSRRLGDTPANQ